MAYFTASCDDAETNKKFAESIDLDYPILSDPEGKAAKAFGVYNVGRGIQTSIKELAELLLKLSGREDLGIQYEPAGQTFVTNRIGCPKAAKEDLGYEWTIDLEDGMKTLIEWRNTHKAEVDKRRRGVQG